MISINLQGETALITGGNKGIGRAIANTLAEAGCKVVLSYLSDAEGAADTVEQIRAKGGCALAVQADVTVMQDVADLVMTAEQHWGQPVSILVNNAGHMIQRCANSEMTAQLYDQVMDVNLKGTVFVTKQVLPAMKASGKGCVINLTSLAAHNGGGPGASIYAASKAAVITYSKGLAKELAPSGIRVNCVSPGFIGETAFHSTFTTDAVRQATISSIPLGREGKPEDVAHTVLYLASFLACYITGETIEVNGGMYMR